MSASTYWYEFMDEFTLKISILGFRFACSFNMLDLNWNIFVTNQQTPLIHST